MNMNERDALIARVDTCREAFNETVLGTAAYNEAMRDLGKALRALDAYSA